MRFTSRGTRGGTTVKSSGAQVPLTWHLAAARGAASATPSAPIMEHRWGHRRSCRARVCVSAGAGVVGTARVRDVSASGAFLEIALPLPLFSQIAVAVLQDDGARDPLEFTAAVVRNDPDGAGIEWCEPVNGSICRLLACTLQCQSNNP